MIEQMAFGEDRQGHLATLYRLSNAHGMVVEITNYCGIITSLSVPDRTGQSVDVVLGYDTLQAYLDDADTFFGAIVGRYANRISGAQFDLNDQTYKLDPNKGDATLHSGLDGMNDGVWDASVEEDKMESRLCLKYISPHMEQGFPGRLSITVIYALDAQLNRLSIRYHVSTDQDTYLNLTNHSYFNLSGHSSGSALDEVMQINAEAYTPTTSNQVPTGEIAPVAGTPYDFRVAKTIAQDFNSDHPQIKIAHGYDNNFVIKQDSKGELVQALTSYSAATGIRLSLSATTPGLQLYTGNFLNQVGKGGADYSKYTGYALEPQYFPDSMHHDHFPTTLITPDEAHVDEMIYQFDCVD